MHFVLMILLVLTTACSNQETKPSVSIGILPIPDALPLIVAKEKGYFKEEGLNVELISFQSAMERDSAFQAKAIDAMLADMIIATQMQEKGLPITIGFLTTGKRTHGTRFAIVSSPKNTSNTIGLSTNCIIEFVVDRLLGNQPIEKVIVPKIALRLSLLLEGQIGMAALTDPFIDYAMQQGANLVAADVNNDYHIACLFDTHFLKTKDAEYQALVKAYNKAAKEITSDPDAFKDLLVTSCGIPPLFEPFVEVPTFSPAASPTAKQLQEVIDWVANK